MELAIQIEKWVSVPMALAVIICLLALRKLMKIVFYYIGSPSTLKPTNMDHTSSNNFIYSLFMLLNLYKQSRNLNCGKDSSLTCLILQGLTGLCIEKGVNEKMFWLSFLMKPVIYFYKPETIKILLSSSTLTDKSVYYNMVHSWLGTGLFSSSSEKWRKRRKLLTPTFHISILEDFIPVFQEQARVFVSKLQSLTGEPWVDIVPLATLCTLDVICQTIMGVKINAQANENKEYVQAVHELSKAIAKRIMRPWLFPDIIYYMTAEGKKYRSNLLCAHRLTRKVIQEKKEEMLKGDTLKQEAENIKGVHHSEKKRKAFLEFLLEYHFKDPSFTEEDIREEVDSFMFAGHDTTGMGISWFLYCIGLYPEIQKKIFEELDEIFENNTERKITKSDLTKMKYLECCVKESLRLYPPAPLIMRECTETFKVLDHTIYPGSVCSIIPYALHRDRESFPDPERFIPERFIPKNSRERDPYAYIPFSGGPRNCIGQKFAMMELKSLAADVLRRLSVTSLDPRDKVLVTLNLTLKNIDPLRLRFEYR